VHIRNECLHIINECLHIRNEYLNIVDDSCENFLSKIEFLKANET
jgi:hypothetical protein